MKSLEQDNKDLYFMMESQSPSNGFKALLYSINDDPYRSWCSGKSLIPKPQSPIQLSAKMRPGSILVDYWKVPVPIISKKIQKVINDLNIQNIEYFQVEILNSLTHEKNCDYVAFNLLNNECALDLNKSKYKSYKHLGFGVEGSDFSSIVFKSNFKPASLIFRLQEVSNAIVVHESLKNSLEKSGDSSLTFIEPKNWCG